MHCHIYLISVIINKYIQNQKLMLNIFLFSEFMLHCRTSIFPMIQAVNVVMSNFIPVLTVVAGEDTGSCLVGLVRETWKIIYTMYSCPETRPLVTLYLFSDLLSRPDVCPAVPNTRHFTSYSETSSESVFGGLQDTKNEDVVLSK